MSSSEKSPYCRWQCQGSRQAALLRMIKDQESLECGYSWCICPVLMAQILHSLKPGGVAHSAVEAIATETLHLNSRDSDGDLLPVTAWPSETDLCSRTGLSCGRWQMTEFWTLLIVAIIVQWFIHYQELIASSIVNCHLGHLPLIWTKGFLGKIGHTLDFPVPSWSRRWFQMLDFFWLVVICFKCKYFCSCEVNCGSSAKTDGSEDACIHPILTDSSQWWPLHKGRRWPGRKRKMYNWWWIITLTIAIVTWLRSSDLLRRCPYCMLNNKISA